MEYAYITKICTACEQALPLEAFGKKPGTASVERILSSKCKLCKRNYDKARKKASKEADKARAMAIIGSLYFCPDEDQR